MRGIKYMKAYEIVDSENEIGIGVLLYYEKENIFLIELSDELDEWTAPLLFTGFVKKKIFTIPRDISIAWVRERVIPSGRQNINDILSHHKLKEYDEMKLLELSEGKCSQDNLYIRKIDELPVFILDRMKKNLVDVVLKEDNELICFFKDEKVCRFKLSLLCNKMMKNKIEKKVKTGDIEKIIKNEKLYKSGKIGAGGYFITFNNSIDIPASLLYESGKEIDIKMSEIMTFVQNNIIDTSECCSMLSCTRQNLSYMVKKEQLSVVKENVNGNLFLKGEIERNSW